jgi:hypothetical protein
MECTDKFNTMSTMVLARGCFWQTTGATKRGVAIKGGCYNGESCSRNILSEEQATPRHLYTPPNYALYERTVTTETVHSISEIPDVPMFKLPTPEDGGSR